MLTIYKGTDLTLQVVEGVNMSGNGKCQSLVDLQEVADPHFLGKVSLKRMARP